MDQLSEFLFDLETQDLELLAINYKPHVNQQYESYLKAMFSRLSFVCRMSCIERITLSNLRVFPKLPTSVQKRFFIRFPELGKSLFKLIMENYLILPCISRANLMSQKIT